MTSTRARVVLSVLVFGACGDGAGGGRDGGGGGPDVSPPSTPTNLSARLIEANTVDLTWDPSIDDVGVTGYRVFRDGNQIGTAPGTSFVDGAAPLAEICYTVSAFDAAGNESGQSDPACLDIPRSWIIRAAGVDTTLESIAWSGEILAAVGSDGQDADNFMLSADGILWLPKHHQFYPGSTLIESDGSQFVLFTGLGIYVSPDGLSGTFVGDDPWVGLDLGADLVWSGSELIAVGPGGRIFATTDGENWTERTSNATEALKAIVSTGSQLVTVGDGGTIVTSVDGMNWTPQDSGTTEQLERVAWSGSRFLALSSSELLSSSDGTTWMPQGAPPPGIPTAMAGSDSLDLFALVGWNGLIATSPDGSTWTEREIASPHGFFDVIWADDQFVAVGELGVVATSSDGATWDVRSSGDHFFGVAWLGDRMVAVGAAGKLSVSTDGIHWTHGWTGDGNYVGLDIASSGSTYVLGGYMALLSSPDLQSWTSYPIGSQECRGVIWTGTVFAAACTGSAVRISSNGTDWTAYFVDGTFATDVNDVTWTGSQYVVVGEAGSIFTSPDGTTWTLRTSGTLGRLRGVAWSGSRLVAVGDGGVVLTSTDGVTWTPATIDSTEPMYDVSWLDDQFVAVGGNQTIIFSSDGLTWEDRGPTDVFPRLNAVSAVNGKVVIVADDGHIFMSP